MEKKKTRGARPRKGTVEEQAIRDRCNILRSIFRRAWSRDPKRYKCLSDNKREYKGTNTRQKYEHQCNICKKWFKQDYVQIDHVIPCGSFLELTPECIGNFIFKMFEGELQKVCKDCHKIKTKQERLK